ncbi:MAG: choice-of-anchor B family protein [Rhodothermales bacterium]|nr:choice-of-anchor B family protein [Rhodothermales bacterium]
MKRKVATVVLLAFPVLIASAQQVCENGSAGDYPCSGINLQSFMPRAEIGGGNMNDIWGWTDPQTGVEYALVGRTSGTSFIDMSQPLNPRFVGNLGTQSVSSTWRDIKVYKNHAFIVADGASSHGMQIFDLTRLRDPGQTPVQFSADFVYRRVQSAHNIAINEKSGYAYIVGSGECAGGLHMVDISQPLDPQFAGCYSEDGYTHDAQCVAYSGPDADYLGQELCFASNTDTITIVDVTDKTDPVTVFRAGYPGSGYVHQGWLTGDQRYFIQNDELDELNNGSNTTTYFWDLTDLDSPEIITILTGPNRSIDHNLYVRGNFVFQSNYTSGLRILDIRDITNPEEIAYFDTYPSSDGPSFAGSWSNYPYFTSGNIPVTSMGEGLYIVRPTVPLLPAALTVFEASLDDDEQITISWTTLREVDIASYDVQQQIPGGTFRTLATVAGSGTTIDETAYEAEIGRTEPGPQVFRLLIRTESGDEYFSDTISVFVPVSGSHELFAAFPNPTSTVSRIALVIRNEQRVIVVVYDATGRERARLSDTILEPDTRHTFQIDATDLAAGTYFVRVVGNDFDSTTAVAVVK